MGVCMNYFDRFKQLVWSAGIPESEVKKIQKVIDDYNAKSLGVFSITATTIFLVLSAISIFVSYMNKYIIVYLLGAIFSILCFIVNLLYKNIYKTNRKVLVLGIALFVATIFGFGIVAGTIFAPKEAASTYVALIFALPVVFCIRPLYVGLSLIISDGIFIYLVCLFKEQVIRDNDILNVITFSIVSLIVSTYVAYDRNKRYLLEYELDYVSSTDQMTELKNRNSYEKRILQLDEMDSKVTCVYVDVNGLHELNNLKGHEAGDQMLKYIAAWFIFYFGKYDTYRVGGDEYVAFVIDGDETEIESNVKAFITEVEKKDYNVAVGFYSNSINASQGITTFDIIKKSEVQMFKMKDEYYKRTGLPHR